MNGPDKQEPNITFKRSEKKPEDFASIQKKFIKNLNVVSSSIEQNTDNVTNLNNSVQNLSKMMNVMVGIPPNIIKSKSTRSLIASKEYKSLQGVTKSNKVLGSQMYNLGSGIEKSSGSIENSYKDFGISLDEVRSSIDELKDTNRDSSSTLSKVLKSTVQIGKDTAKTSAKIIGSVTNFAANQMQVPTGFDVKSDLDQFKQSITETMSLGFGGPVGSYVASFMGQAIKNAISKLKGSDSEYEDIPQYAKGTKKVPGSLGEPKIAIIHGGEKIIPPTSKVYKEYTKNIPKESTGSIKYNKQKSTALPYDSPFKTSSDALYSKFDEMVEMQRITISTLEKTRREQVSELLHISDILNFGNSIARMFSDPVKNAIFDIKNGIKNVDFSIKGLFYELPRFVIKDVFLKGIAKNILWELVWKNLVIKVFTRGLLWENIIRPTMISAAESLFSKKNMIPMLKAYTLLNPLKTLSVARKIGGFGGGAGSLFSLMLQNPYLSSLAASFVGFKMLKSYRETKRNVIFEQLMELKEIRQNTDQLVRLQGGTPRVKGFGETIEDWLDFAHGWVLDIKDTVKFSYKSIDLLRHPSKLLGIGKRASEAWGGIPGEVSTPSRKSHIANIDTNIEKILSKLDNIILNTGGTKYTEVEKMQKDKKKSDKENTESLKDIKKWTFLNYISSKALPIAIATGIGSIAIVIKQVIDGIFGKGTSYSLGKTALEALSIPLKMGYDKFGVPGAIAGGIGTYYGGKYLGKKIIKSASSKLFRTAGTDKASTSTKKGILSKIGAFGKNIFSKMGPKGKLISSGLAALGGSYLIKQLTDSGEIPQYAEGGVVPGSPTQPTLAWLHGQETVKPAKPVWPRSSNYKSTLNPKAISEIIKIGKFSRTKSLLKGVGGIAGILGLGTLGNLTESATKKVIGEKSIVPDGVDNYGVPYKIFNGINVPLEYNEDSEEFYPSVQMGKMEKFLGFISDDSGSQAGTWAGMSSMKKIKYGALGVANPSTSSLGKIGSKILGIPTATIASYYTFKKELSAKSSPREAVFASLGMFGGIMAGAKLGSLIGSTIGGPFGFIAGGVAGTVLATISSGVLKSVGKSVGTFIDNSVNFVNRKIDEHYASTMKMLDKPVWKGRPIEGQKKITKVVPKYSGTVSGFGGFFNTYNRTEDVGYEPLESVENSPESLVTLNSGAVIPLQEALARGLIETSHLGKERKEQFEIEKEKRSEEIHSEKIKEMISKSNKGPKQVRLTEEELKKFFPKEYSKLREITKKKGIFRYSSEEARKFRRMSSEEKEEYISKFYNKILMPSSKEGANAYISPEDYEKTYSKKYGTLQDIKIRELKEKKFKSLEGGYETPEMYGLGEVQGPKEDTKEQLKSLISDMYRAKYGLGDETQYTVKTDKNGIETVSVYDNGPSKPPTRTLKGYSTGEKSYFPGKEDYGKRIKDLINPQKDNFKGIKQGSLSEIVGDPTKEIYNDYVDSLLEESKKSSLSTDSFLDLMKKTAIKIESSFANISSKTGDLVDGIKPLYNTAKDKVIETSEAVGDYTKNSEYAIAFSNAIKKLQTGTVGKIKEIYDTSSPTIQKAEEKISKGYQNTSSPTIQKAEEKISKGYQNTKTSVESLTKNTPEWNNREKAIQKTPDINLHYPQGFANVSKKSVLSDIPKENTPEWNNSVESLIENTPEWNNRENAIQGTPDINLHYPQGFALVSKESVLSDIPKENTPEWNYREKVMQSFLNYERAECVGDKERNAFLDRVIFDKYGRPYRPIWNGTYTPAQNMGQEWDIPTDNWKRVLDDSTVQHIIDSQLKAVNSKQKAEEKISKGYQDTKTSVESLTKNPPKPLSMGMGPSGTIANLMGMGTISAMAEGGNVNTISSGKNDPGGRSYGSWQLSSEKGTMTDFLKSSWGSDYRDYFKGLTPGTNEFDAKYKEVSSIPGFNESQRGFMYDTHYKPFVNDFQKAGLDINNRGIQELIWSTGTQNRYNTPKILAKTMQDLGGNVSDPNKFVDTFYKNRYGMYGEGKSYAKGLRNRYFGEDGRVAETDQIKQLIRDDMQIGPLLNKKDVANYQVGLDTSKNSLMSSMMDEWSEMFADMNTQNADKIGKSLTNAISVNNIGGPTTISKNITNNSSNSSNNMGQKNSLGSLEPDLINILMGDLDIV